MDFDGEADDLVGQRVFLWRNGFRLTTEDTEGTEKK